MFWVNPVNSRFQAPAGRPLAGAGHCGVDTSSYPESHRVGPNCEAWPNTLTESPIRALKLAHNLGQPCTIFVAATHNFAHLHVADGVGIAHPIEGVQRNCRRRKPPFWVVKRPGARPHKKAPYELHLLWETLRALNRLTERARTGSAARCLLTESAARVEVRQIQQFCQWRRRDVQDVVTDAIHLRASQREGC
jgi:hypothetical protein